jgi:TRAP-type C4-dicarboxylate transport system permease small subunit
VKALLYMFGDIVMFVVAVIALYWSWESVHVSWKFGSVTHGLRISQVWFLFAVPFGFALVIFRLTSPSCAISTDLRNGRPSTKATSCSTREGPP